MPQTRVRRFAGVGLLLLVAACAAAQYGDRSGLNSAPFSQVKKMAGDEGKARAAAKQGNIDFFAGRAVEGQAVSLRGELTDANCYLSTKYHGYDHAFCAKYCVATGSPVVFLSDQNSQLYLVITPKDGEPLPETVLDRIGVPGVVVKGRLLAKPGANQPGGAALPTLAVESVE
jgi:hypothetical protein